MSIGGVVLSNFEDLPTCFHRSLTSLPLPGIQAGQLMAAREAWHRNDRFPLPALFEHPTPGAIASVQVAPRVAKCCLRTEKIASRDVLTK